MATDRQDRLGKKTLVTYVDEALWEDIRLLAIKNRTTTQDIMQEAARDILLKYDPSKSRGASRSAPKTVSDPATFSLADKRRTQKPR